jgi:acetyltransferase-like isoleucine patch superfamily enzyme
MQDNVAYIDKKKHILKLLKKNPLEWFHILSTVMKTFDYRYVRRCVGKKTIVGKKTEIINFSQVKIGSHCLIQDHVYIRAGLDGSISIGDYCAINSFAKLFGHGGIKMGDYSQVGPGSLITTTSHDYREALATEFKEVSIGEWAWIGAHCVILPGVTVGDHSVIGAGSIVTKDIPPYSIAVGSPAKVIGKNEKD